MRCGNSFYCNLGFWACRFEKNGGTPDPIIDLKRTAPAFSFARPICTNRFFGYSWAAPPAALAG